MTTKFLLAIALMAIVVQLASASSISPHFKRRFRNKSPQLVAPNASGNRFAAQRARKMPYAASRFTSSHQASANSAKGMERNKYDIINDARKRTHRPNAGASYGSNPYNQIPSQFYPNPSQQAPANRQGPVAPWMKMKPNANAPAMMAQPQFRPPGISIPNLGPNAQPIQPYSYV